MKETLRKAPARFGKYRVVNEVGQGGMATVYKARDEVLGKTVAIKALRPELTAGEQYLERFRREARIVASLEHPNIISVFDYGCEDGVYYFVMSYVEGVSVYEIIVRLGRLPRGDAVRIALDLLSALEYAHERDVIHRDLKPENFMIDRSGRTILTDFGIARPLVGSSLTRVSQRVGTPMYMAPEQVRGERLDGRTDLYAIGLALYEMLTGTVPFSGKDDVEIGRRHVVEAPRPPSAHNPLIGSGIESVILKALAKKQEDRYSSAVAMAMALQKGAEQDGLTVPVGAHPDTMVDRLTPITVDRSMSNDEPSLVPLRTVDDHLDELEQETRRRRIGALVFVVFIALVVMAVWFLVRRSSSLVTITTIPSGAVIEEAGRLWPGTTPMALVRTRVGERHLAVSKPGWQSVRVILQVEPGRLSSKTIVLTPDHDS